ncbi:Checkpoint protein HUS1 [Halotydeus destructor]|nr:Checkpoint protein HUS1 [Halotydeus destructor]
MVFFKAKITHPDHFLTFHRVVRTFTSHARLFVLRITKQQMFFIATQFYTKGTCMLFAELPAADICNEFVMQGVMNLNGSGEEIYLEIEGLGVLHALKDWLFVKSETGRIVSFSKSLTMKLSRHQQQAVLKFEIETQNERGTMRRVSHNLPVNIISRQKWKDFTEPSLADCEVNFALPSSLTLKNLITRLRCIAPKVKITGSAAGTLDFRAEAHSGAITSSLIDLHMNSSRMDVDGDSTQNNGQAVIDVAILHNLLFAFATENSVISLYIENDKKVGLFIQSHTLNVQCVFPHYQGLN